MGHPGGRRRRWEAMGDTLLLRDQLRQAHEFLDGAIADVTDDQAHWVPHGLANPLGATYAHILIGEDALVSVLGGRHPLFAENWAGCTGVSELPPLAEPGSALPLGTEWFAWGRRLRVEMPVLRSYGKSVWQASDDYLSALSDDDLASTFDFTSAGFGNPSLAWMLSAGLIGHVFAHWGEIVCLKGLQGQRGFPV